MKTPIVVTGIAGRLGRRLAISLAKHYHVIGIDRRPCLGLPEGVEHHRVDLRRRSAEEIFRTCGAKMVIHLGVVHNFRIPSEQLFARNVIGTETLLRYASDFGFTKVVVLSSADVYGPSPTNSHFIREDAPLMASQRFPEIRTLVAVDRSVQAFFWRKSDIETVLLRPAHILGPTVRNAPSNYLRLRILPTLMGFDPMLQFIHEDDVVQAIVHALQPGYRGIFNLVGCEPIPLHRVLRMVGKPIFPVPHFVLSALLKRAWKYRLTTFPAPELDHIRFNTVLDTQLSETVLQFKAKYSLYDMLEPFRVYLPRSAHET